MAFRVKPSASPSSKASAATVALCRAPGALPAGLPDTPLRKTLLQPYCFKPIGKPTPNLVMPPLSSARARFHTLQTAPRPPPVFRPAGVEGGMNDEAIRPCEFMRGSVGLR